MSVAVVTLEEIEVDNEADTNNQDNSEVEIRLTRSLRNPFAHKKTNQASWSSGTTSWSVYRVLVNKIEILTHSCTYKCSMASQGENVKLWAMALDGSRLSYTTII